MSLIFVAALKLSLLLRMAFMSALAFSLLECRSQCVIPHIGTRDQTHSFVTVHQLNNVSSTIFIRNKVTAHKGNKDCEGKG